MIYCITCSYYGGVRQFFTREGSFPYQSHSCIARESRTDIVTGVVEDQAVPCVEARKVGKPCGPEGKLHP